MDRLITLALFIGFEYNVEIDKYYFKYSDKVHIFYIHEGILIYYVNDSTRKISFNEDECLEVFNMKFSENIKKKKIEIRNRKINNLLYG